MPDHEGLTDRLGSRAASLVAIITEDRRPLNAGRKRFQIEHVAHASVGARLITPADKTSNLRSLAVSPLANWSAERRADHIAWSGRVLADRRAADPWL